MGLWMAPLQPRAMAAHQQGPLASLPFSSPGIWVEGKAGPGAQAGGEEGAARDKEKGNCRREEGERMREGRAGEGERDGEEARGRTDRLRRQGRASLVDPWLRLRTPHAGVQVPPYPGWGAK